mgnify:CR=1 FL=1
MPIIFDGNSFIIYVSIINSYEKTIKITQISDSHYFLTFESLIKQVIFPQEDTNLFILTNCPDDTIREKIRKETIITRLLPY